MKSIEWLSEKITEEIHDAICYAKKALEWKDSDRETARVLHTLAEEEMEHMQRLHERVAAIIKSYREEHGEPPAAMMAVYEYLHKQHVEHAAEASATIAMFK